MPRGEKTPATGVPDARTAGPRELGAEYSHRRGGRPLRALREGGRRPRALLCGSCGVPPGDCVLCGGPAGGGR